MIGNERLSKSIWYVVFKCTYKILLLNYYGEGVEGGGEANK